MTLVEELRERARFNDDLEARAAAEAAPPSGLAQRRLNSAPPKTRRRAR